MGVLALTASDPPGDRPGPRYLRGREGVSRAPVTLADTWGHGPAKLVKWVGGTTETGVCLSDLHEPHLDRAVWAAALKLLRYVKPDRVVLNGDLGDFFQLSRFNTGKRSMDTLQEEIDLTNDRRAEVRKACPDAWVDENEGNHDNRIRSYVANEGRALASLRCLNPDELFKYKELDIHWHPGAGFRVRNDFVIKHGTIVRGEAGASAKGEHLLSGVSGISGHTHKLASYTRSGYVQRKWQEQGCLCRVDPDYVVGAPNWQQGLVVYEIARSGSFVIHEVPWVDGSLRLGLKRF